MSHSIFMEGKCIWTGCCREHLCSVRVT